MIFAGKLRNKIDIEQQGPAQNTYGEPTQSWSAFLTGIFSSIEPISGREFHAGDIENSELTHQIRIRYHAGILPKMRVKYGARYFFIESIKNYNELNKEQLLICRELI